MQTAQTNSDDQMNEHTRILSSDEIATLVKNFRAVRDMKQATLAELASMNLRTLQRIEACEPANKTSLELLAQAMGFEENFFSTPQFLPSNEELARMYAEWQKEYMTVKATPIVDWRGVRELLLNNHLWLFEEGPMDVETTKKFADFRSYLADLDLGYDLMSETELVRHCEEAFEILERALGIDYIPYYGKFVSDDNWKCTLVAPIPRDHEPSSFVVKRNVSAMMGG